MLCVQKLNEKATLKVGPSSSLIFSDIREIRNLTGVISHCCYKSSCFLLDYSITIIHLSICFFSDSFLIDGHIDSFEDVERCSHCKAPIPIYHCDVCDVNMCRVCVSEHDSNDSKEHKVVALKTLERIAKFDTKCTKHFVTYCNLYCEQCDISVCDECVSSKKHIGHEISKMRKPEGLIYILQRDLEKL